MSEKPSAATARQLPRSDEAEKGLLGSMLHRPSLIDDLDDLSAEAIWDPARRRILETMREMAVRCLPVDLITLTQKLEDSGILADVGGPGAIAELIGFVPAAANWKQYAEIVREKWICRKLIAVGHAIMDIAYDDADGIEDRIGRCEEAAIKLRTETMPGNADAVKHCQPAAMAAIDHIEAVYSHRGKPLGLTTGLTDWDRMTGGFKPAEMIVIGARPSNGKTSLGMQIAEHNAIECKRPTLFFSVEMSAEQLMTRTLCARTKVDLQRVRDGFLRKDQVPQLMETFAQVTGSPLYLDETGELTVSQFRSRARLAKVRHKIELIVVDYLQIMRSTSKRAKENRQIEVAEISGTLKAVAKELKIPVVVLAQLSRDVESLSRPPRLSDLRESGSIEQDADQVVLIHRLDKAKKKRKNADPDEEEEEMPYNTLLLLEKQRNGPVGDIKIKFIPNYTVFENVTEQLYSNNPTKRQQ